MKEYVCEICGKSFKSYKQRKYCGKKCYGESRIGLKKAQRIKIKCLNCGKEFEVMSCDSRLKKNGIKFCSVKCRGEYKRIYDKLIGKKYGRLTILKYIYKGRHKAYFLCQCECGNKKVIEATSVKNGYVKSCGCLHQEQLKIQKPRTTHGKCRTRIYRIWSGMKDRCYNQNYFQYYLYGGKGIKVCNEWLDKKTGFVNFYEWAINNGYKDNLSIDRIDGNKNYEPSNCRWVTQKEQCRNICTNINITYNGETHCLTEWAEILNIKFGTLYWRYKNWEDINKIFNEGLWHRKN